MLHEIITGFGRTGKMFCFEHYGIVPDMLVGAKGVTSGSLVDMNDTNLQEHLDVNVKGCFYCCLWARCFSTEAFCTVLQSYVEDVLVKTILDRMLPPLGRVDTFSPSRANVCCSDHEERR